MLTTAQDRAQLLAAAYPGDLSVRSLLDFCTLPPEVLDQLAQLAAPEDWGDRGDVLQRYLAVHVPLAVEQGRYVWSGKELVMRAGHLTTATGAALYLGLSRAEGDRWRLAWASDRPANLENLIPPDLGPWPEIDPGLEVLVAMDQVRVPQLAGLPLVTQQAAVAGAVEWSLRRGLAVRHLHGGCRMHFVPLHLTDRDGAPDLAAPMQVQSDRLLVRALIEPWHAYASARAVAERRELPAWLLDAWERVRARPSATHTSNC